jgi:squalene-hopene/tetraprenyl-beta-curcumene cyclase
MRVRIAYCMLFLMLCAGSFAIWRVARVNNAQGPAARDGGAAWNPRIAESYLDSREVWWQKWPSAQMDHGTVCVSCHTVLPYALVQPELRHELGENGMTASEQAMLGSVEKRVADWSQTTPYYTDALDGPGKTQESRATESILNAVILSSYDGVQGHLSPLTRLAYDQAWALQLKAGEDAGGWRWQNFHQAPWESSESAYQGAAMMAMAVGEAPDYYASGSAFRDNLDLLKQYLRRKYDAQPLMSKLYVLWASAQMPGLLTEDQEARLLDQVAGLQLSDGGWELSSLDEQSRKHAYLDTWRRLTRTGKSDGCATGLVVLAMETAAVKQHEEIEEQGLQWLEKHQAKDGSWRAVSMNGPRDVYSDIGRFMSDAATGYAVLALEKATQKNAGLARQRTALLAGRAGPNRE